MLQAVLEFLSRWVIPLGILLFFVLILSQTVRGGRRSY